MAVNYQCKQCDRYNPSEAMDLHLLRDRFGAYCDFIAPSLSLIDEVSLSVGIGLDWCQILKYNDRYKVAARLHGFPAWYAVSQTFFNPYDAKYMTFPVVENLAILVTRIQAFLIDRI